MEKRKTPSRERDRALVVVNALGGADDLSLKEIYRLLQAERVRRQFRLAPAVARVVAELAYGHHCGGRA